MALYSLPEIIGLLLLLFGALLIAGQAFLTAETISQRGFVIWQSLCFSTFCVSIIAWLVGGAILVHHGGYPSEGKMEDGVHYVRYKAGYTQVSEDTWTYLERVEYWTSGRAFVTGAIGFSLFFLSAYLLGGKRGCSVADAFEWSKAPTSKNTTAKRD